MISSFECNGQTLRFLTTLEGGDWVEYVPEDNKATVHRQNMTFEEIDVEGEIEVGEGYFEMSCDALSLTQAPFRARLVTGFYGIELTN